MALTVVIFTLVNYTYVDIEPPKFTSCPATLVAGTNNGVNTSEVDWKEPSGQDNSAKALNIFLKSGHSPKSKLLAGQYQIVYGIKDNDGNVGKDCTFSVIVRGKPYRLSNLYNLYAL